MSDFELRIVLALGFANTLQYRTKNVHIDSSTVRPVDMGWSEWIDVPMVWHPKYKPEDK